MECFYAIIGTFKSIGNLGEAIEHETFIEYHLNVEAKSGFATFKASVLDAKEIITLNKKEQDSKERVLCKLKNFDLANHTPMQAMEFIKELKELLWKNTNRLMIFTNCYYNYICRIKRPEKTNAIRKINWHLRSTKRQTFIAWLLPSIPVNISLNLQWRSLLKSR